MRLTFSFRLPQNRHIWKSVARFSLRKIVFLIRRLLKWFFCCLCCCCCAKAGDKSWKVLWKFHWLTQTSHKILAALCLCTSPIHTNSHTCTVSVRSMHSNDRLWIGDWAQQHPAGRAGKERGSTRCTTSTSSQRCREYSSSRSQYNRSYSVYR